MSDTPRTDAFQNERHTMNAYRKVLAFARTLEQELTRLRADNQRLQAECAVMLRGLQAASEISCISDYPQIEKLVYGALDSVTTLGKDLLERLERAEEWKRSQLEVENSWDCQSVGRLLNMPLGVNIRPLIEPAISKLIAEKSAAEQRVEQCREVISCVEWNGHKVINDGSWYSACPFCEFDAETSRHEKDCKLAAALRQSLETKEGK